MTTMSNYHHAKSQQSNAQQLNDQHRLSIVHQDPSGAKKPYIKIIDSLILTYIK